MPDPFDTIDNQDHTLKEISVLCDVLKEDRLIDVLLRTLKQNRELSQYERDNLQIDNILYLMKKR
jgi:hypothetical protein